jgi:hypothetical protein
LPSTGCAADYPAAAPSVRWAAAGVFTLVSVLRLVPECEIEDQEHEQVLTSERPAIVCEREPPRTPPDGPGSGSALEASRLHARHVHPPGHPSTRQNAFGHLTGHRLLPAADTEVGCPQSLGREAGILAGVLEATACDPSKLKPTRQLHSRAHGPQFPRVRGVPAGDTRGLHDIASTPMLSGQCGKHTAGEGPRR